MTHKSGLLTGHDPCPPPKAARASLITQRPAAADAREYKEAKAYCYSRGIPSQAFAKEVVTKRGVPTALAIKINGKLGGVVWNVAGDITSCVGLGDKRVMLLGMDVSHGQTGGQGGQGLPSTAAVVGTVDK
jgi:hypothetical protein